MPKRITIPSILIVIAAIIGFSLYTGEFDGATAQSREEILNRKYVGARIVSEEQIDNLIVSGITTDSGECGLAVFETKGNEKYELQAVYLKSGGDVIEGKAKSSVAAYDLFWLNRLDFERAELTYKSGGETEVAVLDVDGQIAWHKAPAESYTLTAVFYDADGGAHR